MRSQRLAQALCALAFLSSIAYAQTAQLNLSQPISVEPGWKLGRATYYGAPEQVVRAYDPTRGTGSFGIVAFGACGYTNVPSGDLPFPRESYAAAADYNPDYPGSCGRCYEVRCKPGFVLSNSYEPIRLVYPGNSTVAYFDGDYARPYLPSINSTVKDDTGRAYPGNPTESQGLLSTVCYNNTASVRVRIADQCPCKQVLPDGAPGVAPGGETRRQEWCCGPVQHFDLAYWAFEKLAHSVSGAMMLEYRSVDCETGLPVPDTTINSTVYSTQRGIEAGWGWRPYLAYSASLQVKGAAYDGGYATCARLTPRGAIPFVAREAWRPGFQPFANKTYIQFAIRSNTDEADNSTSTPRGQIPTSIKLFVMVDPDRYCRQEAVLGVNIQPVVTKDGWYVFMVPISFFQCPQASVSESDLDRFDFQNIADRDASICLTEIKLV